MHRDNDRTKLFTRRAALLAGGKLALLSALVGRMYYLQVVESERYTMLADENRISLRLLPPLRGLIVDRFGEPIATNRQNYRVLLVSEQTNGVGETLDRLGRVIPISEADRQRVLREVRRRRSFVPVTVRENLEWDDVARIEINAPDLPGVMIDVGQTRHYPYGPLAAHVLGYVAAVSEAELGGDPLLELPGFRIGKAGIEKVHDAALRGKGGTSQVEVNALGRVIRELSRAEGQPGAELPLTIDMAIQQFAYQRMGEESGAAVVIDVRTGEVLALASVPGYDPNAFNAGLSSEDWRTLVANPKAPLINKAIAGQYAPGSTFKMVVTLAALEAGIDSGASVFCTGVYDFGNTKFHCWKKGGHGSIDMVGALKHSCDSYFYEMAKRVGIDRIADMGKRLGFGAPTGIDLPNEQGGVMPNRDWKRAALGQPWHNGETLVAGIGQGYVLATPLQLAVMTARIANGGYMVVPRVTRSPLPAGRDGPPPFAPVALPPKGIALVRRGMEAVVNEAGGTAFSQRIREPGWEMGGKTGTAQVRRITLAERATGVKKNEQLPWKERDHALFVCYAPVSEPRYAVAVIVEHGGGGSAVAAPIARDIMVETLRRDPSRTAPPPARTAARGDGSGEG